MSESSDMHKLAPSGVSPWDHQVEIDGGRLVLYWKKGKEEGIRTFTLEETSTLLSYLMLHKHEIDLECYKRSLS